MGTAVSDESTGSILRVRSLTIDFWSHGTWTNVVHRVTFDIAAGETLGLAGESGCGKSTTAYSLLGYRRSGSRIREGSVYFEGVDLLKLPDAALQRIRGSRVSLVPQNPATALNPAIPVGAQVEETLLVHRVAVTRKEAGNRSIDLLAAVGLPQPTALARRYPHQLSGGQQQRVVLAMALACNPSLLVLDEPTTSLDATTQASILNLLRQLQTAHGMAMLYVSHNMAVLAQICHRVAIMYAGEIIETARVEEIFRSPRHPYTLGLISSARRLSGLRADGVSLRGLLKRDELPPGCRFAPRCNHAQPECFVSSQLLVPIAPGHQVACCRLPWIASGGNEIEGASAEAPSGRSPVPRLTMSLARGDVVHSPQHGHGGVLFSSPRDKKIGLGDRWQEQPDAQSPVPLLEVRNLSCAYRPLGALLGFSRRAPETVVRSVSLSLATRETLGLVGETGSGKSTIARAIAGLVTPTGGQIFLDGQDISCPVERRNKEVRRQIQLIPQNPDASLNPRHRVGGILGRPLEFFFGVTGSEQRRRVITTLEAVHLDPRYMRRFPYELSGGERQRVAVARALVAEPRVLLCDEILSALDVSVQASILDLMRELQHDRGLAYLFITHDLGVVRSLAHRIAVLYGGELCEIGRVEEIFAPPFHPYTRLLLDSMPEPLPGASTARQVPPVSETRGKGYRPACPFADRCPLRVGDLCDRVSPPWHILSETHAIRCHLPVTELEESPRPSRIARM